MDGNSKLLKLDNKNNQNKYGAKEWKMFALISNLLKEKMMYNKKDIYKNLNKHMDKIKN